MPECMPDKTPEYMPDKMPGRMSEHMIECQNICQNMARQQKAAYVRPIKDSSVVAGRVSEQVCGRLVHHYTETFKKGTSKSVAVLVDDNALRSVLVLEAWSVADQTHMQNAADRLATSQTKKNAMACLQREWLVSM